MTNIVRYTLEDYQRILKEGFNFDIPAYTNNTINALADEVGAPTYIKTPEFFIRRQEEYDNINSTNFLKNRRNKKYKIQEITDDDWENIRIFQATELKEKTSYEKQLDIVRTILNRVTEDRLEDEVLALLQLLEDNNTDNDFIKDTAKLIIEFTTSNVFYSNLYAIIYNRFIVKYDEWRCSLNESLSIYKASLDNITFLNAEEDYDKFCESNKINLNRRALSTFFSNLFEQDCLSKLEIINIVLDIQKIIKKYVKEDKKKEHVAELTENLVLILNIIWEKLNSNSNKEESILISEIVVNILNISRSKPLVVPNVSLTHKVVFKHIDLVKSLTII